MKIYITFLTEKFKKKKFNSFTRSYMLIYRGQKYFLSSLTIIINDDMNVIVPLQIWMIVI